MVFDFAFGNALRFDLPSEFLDSETTLDVPSSVASTVDTELANGGRVPFVLADSATITPNTTIEIVYATSADTGASTLTVTRGQEGTTPATWPSGTVAQNALTAFALNTLKQTLLGQDDFQIRLLEANKLLDATDASAELEFVLPAATRAWSWRIFLIPVDLDLGGEPAALPSTSVGVTSGGTEISTELEWTIDEVGRRYWSYTGDNGVGTNDRFFVNIVDADTSINTLKARVLLEVTVGPKSKSGF